MTTSAGTQLIPSDQYDVIAGSIVAVGLGVNRVVGIVGGMNTSEGSANTGEAVQVSGSSEARDLFGKDSELHIQVKKAYQNGATNVWCVPLTETEITESFSSVSDGTLSNVPIIDPTINTEHSITAQDTVEGSSVDVNISYDDPPSTPTSSNTMNLNPRTGDFDADESSDYDITYEYNDFGIALDTILEKNIRYVAVCTESESVANTLATKLDNLEEGFTFIRGVVGAKVGLTPSSYSDNLDDQRIVLVATSRANVDSTTEARTVGAVAGKIGGKPLGDSTTYETIGGFTSLRNTFSYPDELETLINSQVTPLHDTVDGIEIVKDMTTSTEPKFERAYETDIIDHAVQEMHLITKEFVGELNSEDNRNILARSLRKQLGNLEDNEPDPLLEDYDITVTEGSNDDEVDVEAGLDTTGLMDNINVDVVIGDVVRFEGTS